MHFFRSSSISESDKTYKAVAKQAAIFAVTEGKKTKTSDLPQWSDDQLVALAKVQSMSVEDYSVKRTAVELKTFSEKVAVDLQLTPAATTAFHKQMSKTIISVEKEEKKIAASEEKSRVASEKAAAKVAKQQKKEESKNGASSSSASATAPAPVVETRVTEAQVEAVEAVKNIVEVARRRSIELAEQVAQTTAETTVVETEVITDTVVVADPEAETKAMQEQDVAVVESVTECFDAKPTISIVIEGEESHKRTCC